MTYIKGWRYGLGTGNLTQHRLDNDDDELEAIQAELKRLGLKSMSEVVYD